MRAEDEKRFYSFLTDVSSYYKSDMSQFVMDVWFDGLLDFSFEEVAQATRHYARNAKNGNFMPKVSDIVKIILASKPADGKEHLSVEHAWAIAMRFIENEDTAVVIDEVTANCAGIVTDLLLAGDRFGANKAFASIYEDAVNEARRTGKSRACFVSQGSNAEQTARVAREAANAGLIDEQVAIAYENKAGIAKEKSRQDLIALNYEFLAIDNGDRNGNHQRAAKFDFDALVKKGIELNLDPRFDKRHLKMVG